MFKIGFVGNSCTGKTTSCFSLIKLLKLKKTLTSYCTDACRFVTFNPEKFDTDPKTRLHVLFKQMANELEQEVREDADYLITERTVIDWFIYYIWTCKASDNPISPEVESLVNEWIRTYEIIFFMDAKSMYYVDDGFRPASTKIRNEVNELYDIFLYKLQTEFPGQVILIEGDDLEKRNQLVEDKMNEWLAKGKNLVVREGKIRT